MSRRILVIEDEALFREQLVEYLNLVFPGLSIDQASTLAEAYDLCQRYFYHLVISDCILPDGNACDLLRTSCTRIPVIILTGYVQPELFARVLEQRSAPLEVLYKPVSLEKIRTLVERYLARHP
ncbi:response regulator [Thermosulfurimonas sp.]|uniref:response regulator n=1 Tax=Thermosulfurimonas sp. TaxID=2080236 RepID=UPI0025F71D3D|nr:response regulator [Thermosulfurimonas sp.]